MSELTEFLEARIADDESAAQMASGPIWRLGHRDDGYFFVAAESMAIASAPRTEDRAHIARHDPARVLAECQAKRRIVELHMPDHECTDGSTNYPGVFAGDPALGMTVCPTLVALASVYAGHDDYRREWRP